MLEKVGIIRPSNPRCTLGLPPAPGAPAATTAASMRLLFPNRYPTPCPTWGPSNNAWRTASFFSKIDLVKAYHQIPIIEEDISKMGIATSFGLLEFLFMDFGLRNAAQALQHLKDNILMGLDYV